MAYPDLYGSFDIAREYCGFSQFPYPKPTTDRVMWQHGVITWDILIPEQAFGYSIPSFKTKKLVSNKKLLSFFQSSNVDNVYAIGMPSVYLPESSIGRVEDSLLVFPGHGVPGSSYSEQIYKEYAKYILRIANKFKKVEVCIFASEFDRNEFKRRVFEDVGLKVVRGVDDSNKALNLQKKRLLSFSHVTSNVMGSHVSYAGACGCKVSISGPYHNYQREHIENIDFYKKYPEIIDFTLKKYSEFNLKRNFPWLFTEPDQSTTCVKWANEQLGSECKISPKEMCKIFGWNIYNILRSKIKVSEKMNFLLRYAIRSNI